MCKEPAPVLVRSRLECLPVELIQIIFLHCLEFNLPRASIHIARALSDPLIYTWLIRLAFCSDTGESHGLFTPDVLPPPLDFFGMSKWERRDLQNAILESRWCTLPLMRKCQVEYFKHVISFKCKHLVLSPEGMDILSNLEQRIKEVSGNSDAHPDAELILPAKVLKTNEDRPFRMLVHTGTLESEQRGVGPMQEIIAVDEYQFPACRLAPRMPDKLLCPPWTAHKLDFLTLLSQEAYIDDDDMEECIRSRRVLRQVIRDRDFATFQRLVNLRVRFKNYAFARSFPVLPIHFRVALKYADEHKDPFVKLLVEKRWSDIENELHLKDELMTKYAKDNMAGIE